MHSRIRNALVQACVENEEELLHLQEFLYRLQIMNGTNSKVEGSIEDMTYVISCFTCL